MGWKILAGLNVVLAIAVAVDFVFGSYQPNLWSITSYLMSCLAGGMVCLYAFDGRLFSLQSRIFIVIVISVFALVEALIGLRTSSLALGNEPLVLTVAIFAIPLILSVLSLIAAWRYSRGRTVSSARI